MRMPRLKLLSNTLARNEACKDRSVKEAGAGNAGLLFYAIKQESFSCGIA